MAIDKRKNNGGNSTKPTSKEDKRLLTKAEKEQANYVFIKAIKEELKADNDEEAKIKFIRGTLMDSQRGQLFIAEHIFGKAPQEVKQTNLNIDAKDLDAKEIKKINDALEDAY